VLNSSLSPVQRSASIIQRARFLETFLEEKHHDLEDELIVGTVGSKTAQLLSPLQYPFYSRRMDDPEKDLQQGIMIKY